MVQIVARPATPGPEPPAGPGIAGVLDRLATAADDREARFQAVLRRELSRDLIDRAISPRVRGEYPAAQPPGVGGADVRTAPDLLATDRPAPPGMGPPAWSIATLTRLGLPASFTNAAAGLHPADDGAWIHRLAATAAPLLGPLPDGPLRLVGPGSARLATVLGVPAEPPGGTSVHLVLGGGTTDGHDSPAPAAVSWVSDGGVAEALRAAAGTGCPLAYGSTGGFPVDIMRLSPVDVALAIRRLVGRT